MLILKNIMSIIKSFLLAPFILYIFNLMAIGLDIYIPINIVTVCIVGLLGIPGLVTLVLFLIFIF